MATMFNQRVKHGRLDFHPGVSYAFEDGDAAPYFKACGWASDTDEEPAVTITLGELDIDPCTVWGDGPSKGKFVMPDRAAEALQIPLEQAEAFAWAGQELPTNG